MNSRALIIAVFLLGVIAAGFPADAQQAPKIPRIGFLTAGTRASAGQVIDSFRQALRELGYVEGKTVYAGIQFRGLTPLTVVPPTEFDRAGERSKGWAE